MFALIIKFPAGWECFSHPAHHFACAVEDRCVEISLHNRSPDFLHSRRSEGPVLQNVFLGVKFDLKGFLCSKKSFCNPDNLSLIKYFYLWIFCNSATLRKICNSEKNFQLWEKFATVRKFATLKRKNWSFARCPRSPFAPTKSILSSTEQEDTNHAVEVNWAKVKRTRTDIYFTSSVDWHFDSLFCQNIIF